MLESFHIKKKKLSERTTGAGARGIHGDTNDETGLCHSNIAKNTTQSELSRGPKQLDESRNIYSLRYHVSLWSPRTHVTLNSVFGTFQHKRVQDRCSQTSTFQLCVIFWCQVSRLRPCWQRIKLYVQ